MTGKIFVDDDARKLVMTKAFYKRACAFGSSEYYELRKAKAENDGFEIAFQYKVSDKKTYNGLSFERMASYIAEQSDSINLMIEFEAVKRIAKAKGATYPLTKEWFFQTFPNYKEDEVKKDETATAFSALNKAAKTVPSNVEPLAIGA